jgi:hypothetical protein
MKTENQAITVGFSAYRVGLRMLIALLVWVASTGCAAAAEPQGSDLGQANFALGQEAPPTGTLEVIQVDLNAIEIDLQNRRAAESCEKLQSLLLQVVESEDPVQTAQALGLRVRENEVQVSLVLDGSDTAFLERAGIDVGTQAGPEIQAFVPISKLCELTTHKNVLAIRPVSQAETQ